MDLTNVYNWARQALGATSTDVPDGDLTLLANSEVLQLAEDYPCVSVAGNVTLFGSDLSNFEEGAGYRVAQRYALTPAGRENTAKLTAITVGPVKEIYSDLDSEVYAKKCLIQASKAMRRVLCVKADGAVDSLSYFGVGGRRRTEGEPRTAINAAFGISSDPIDDPTPDEVVFAESEAGWII
jgi:hypothetical protein